MLRSVKELRDYVLEAKDGEIGRCRDFLLDDSSWVVRYMVADTGKWLPGKKVLISPVSLGEPDWDSKLFGIELTKKQIENSPPLESNAPVSKEYEIRWHEHYRWSPYWHGGGIWGAASVPHPVPQAGRAEATTETATVANIETPSHNIRSSNEIIGYSIQATDGEIGHVEDFIIDDESWSVRYIVVDTRNWLPGKKVLVAPEWAESIVWSDGDVHLNLPRDLIKNGPEYDPKAPVNREYEARLYDYYGRPKYWE